MGETTSREPVDVEQIMRQIRARVREKHGAEYTEKELQQLTSAKLDTVLDPKGTRAQLVAEFKRRATAGSVTDFSEAALYNTHRGWLKSVRRLLNPVLRLFINPIAFSRAMQARHEIDGLVYDVVRHLVVELTRLNLEVHNLKMKVESLSTRVDFDERRTKAFAGVPPSRPVAQERPRPQQQPPPQPPQQQQGRGGFQGRQGSGVPEVPGFRGSGVPAGSGSSAGSGGSGGSGGSAALPSAPQPVVPFSPAPSMAPTGTFAVPAGSPGGSQGGSPDAAGNVGGEPRRRRRRRRRRRPGGQGPQGSTGSAGSQGSAGSSGSTGSSGSASSSGSAGSTGSAGSGSGTDEAGGDWEDGDEGASDQ